MKAASYSPTDYGKDPTLPVLKHIRSMMAVVAGVHVLVFFLLGMVTWRTWNVAMYYSVYLEDPLAGPRVADTISTAMSIVSDVHNVTTVAAAASGLLSSSMGLLPPTNATDVALSPPNATAAHRRARRRLAGRSLLALLQGSPEEMRLGITQLLATAQAKLAEADVRAPSDFLRYLMAINWRADVMPLVEEGLAVLRYGEATAGAVLGALGTPVDPSVVK